MTPQRGQDIWSEEMCEEPMPRTSDANICKIMFDRSFQFRS